MSTKKQLSVKEEHAFRDALAEIAGVEFFVAQPDVVAKVKVAINGHVYNSLGWATCGPKDTFDLDLGKEIAMGRALEKLAVRLSWLIEIDMGVAAELASPAPEYVKFANGRIPIVVYDQAGRHPNVSPA